MNDRDLVSEARSVYAKAQAASADLTAHGLQATILQNFPAQIDALEQRLDKQGTAVDMHTAAKKAALDAIRETRSIVQGLDAILMSAPNVDAFLIEHWKAAKRVGPAPATTSANPQQPASAPPATTPSTSPARSIRHAMASASAPYAQAATGAWTPPRAPRSKPT